MKHLIPEQYSIKQREYDYKVVIEAVQKKMSLKNYGRCISPYLLHCDINIEQQIKKVHQVLHKAIHCLVENYLSDKAISLKMPLPDTHRRLVEMASAVPYRIFALRPDFLVSKTGQIKICEINARFTTNGFIATHWFDQVFYELGKKEKEKRDILSQYIHHFERKKPLFLLRENEQGYDLNLLAQYMTEKGWELYSVRPDEIWINDGKLYAGNSRCEQIIIELLQSELDNFSPGVLDLLIQQSHHINDIRTILLVHDKRFLSLLTDNSLLAKYLPADEISVLQEHIIDTYSLSAVADAVLHAPDKWVLKKCLSGKGEGMYIGSQTDKDVLVDVIAQQANEYIAQPFLSQQLVQIDIDGKIQNCHAVGMLLSLNEGYYGTGFFRVSPQKIIAVSRGGMIVVPLYQKMSQ